MNDINQFLKDCAFYPCCRFHGTPVKYLGQFNFDKYFYCDYGVKLDDLNHEINCGFRGYELKETKDIDSHEIFGMNWDSIVDWKTRAITEQWDSRFSKWYRFQRKSGCEKDHGPENFELLYTSCEGITAFELAFVRRNIAPKANIHILPGISFGGNFKDFAEVFNILFLENPNSIPDYILYDKYAGDVNNLEFIILTNFGIIIKQWVYIPGGRLRLLLLNKTKLVSYLKEFGLPFRNRYIKVCACPESQQLTQDMIDSIEAWIYER